MTESSIYDIKRSFIKNITKQCNAMQCHANCHVESYQTSALRGNRKKYEDQDMTYACELSRKSL